MLKRHNEATAEKYPETTGATLHRATQYDICARLMGLGVNARINRMIIEMTNIKPEDKVLDVGCGTGNLTLTAKKYAGATGTVIGIDASPEMIYVAQRKAKTSGSVTVFDIGLIEKMPFADATFDFVISNLVIHHLPDELKRQAFREIYRVLKPEGTIFMIDFKAPSHSVLSLVFLPVLLHRKMMQSKFVMSAIPPMLTEAGFTDVTTGQTRSVFLAFVTGKKQVGLAC